MLAQADELWIASDEGPNHPKRSTLMPFIKLEDYPLFPAGAMKHFPKDFLTLDAPSFSYEQALELTQMLHRADLKFTFVGEDDHLSELKSGELGKRFFGNRCSGELAPMLAASYAHLSYSMTGFPVMAMQSLSVGVPAIFLKGSESSNFIASDLMMCVQSVDELSGII